VNGYILLLGTSIESGNRGVAALALGALRVLNWSFGARDFVILQISSDERASAKTVTVNGSEVTVRTYYFSKYKYLLAVPGLWLFRLCGKAPASELSRLIINSDRAFNINEGDSFSDIYGCKRIVRHFVDSFLVLLAGRELTFLPQTIGPFKTVLGRMLARYILKRVKETYIRDAQGARLPDRMGIKYRKSVDMSVYMEARTVDYRMGANTVGLNVSGLLFYQGYGRIANRFSCYVTLINRILDALKEKGFSVLLIPHTYDVAAPDREDDLAAIKEIAEGRKDGRLRYIEKDYDAQELKFIISRLDFFIGSRMHSCIAALSNSVPAVGLGYSVKFRGTFEMFKQYDCVIDVGDMTEDDVDGAVARILEKIERRELIRKELEAVNSKLERLIVE
jgi:colanic acid/amylovoran biosynthesis protein